MTEGDTRAKPHSTQHTAWCRNGYSNVVWSTTPEHAAQLEKMAPEAFGAAVNDALTGGAMPRRSGGAAGGLAALLARAAARGGPPRPPRMPPVVEASVGQQPASFPLSMQHAGRCGGRVSFIGLFQRKFRVERERAGLGPVTGCMYPQAACGVWAAAVPGSPHQHRLAAIVRAERRG